MCIRDRELNSIWEQRLSQVTIQTNNRNDKEKFYGALYRCLLYTSIIMEEDSKTLDEVVVVGYGSMSRKDVTSSITTGKAVSYTHLDVYKRQVCANIASIPYFITFSGSIVST